MLSALSALRTSELLSNLNPASTSTANTSGTSHIATTSFSASDLDAGSSDTASPLSKDTVQLLKDLAVGNLSAAKSDVSRLQKDLKAQDTSSSTSSDNALNKLLESISKSLNAGSTSDALSTLAGFLIQTGNTSGSIVNTTA